MRIFFRTRTSKVLLAVLITFPIFGSWAVNTRAQIPSAGPCYSVDTYPQAEKRAELAQFLRDARPLADKTAQQIVDGQIDELYSANQAGFAWGDSALANAQAFRQEFAKFEEKEGKVLRYEFRGQGLTVVGHPPRVDHIYSTAIYAVKTTKWKDGAFLDIRTVVKGPGQVVFQAWVERFSPDSTDRESFGKNMHEVCQEW